MGSTRALEGEVFSVIRRLTLGNQIDESVALAEARSLTLAASDAQLARTATACCRVELVA